jgi:tetratricopeptide (TPR) repeat protein
MTSGPAGDGLGFGPYVGLRAFRSDEHGLFYGRARESLEIARLWRAKKLTVLYGASGVGKTSLLQAGVINALDPSRSEVWPVGRVRTGLPYPAASSRSGNPYTFALLSSWAPGAAPADLAGMTVSEFLNGRAQKEDRYGDPVPILAAIDQFEELFNSLPDLRYREPFIEELAQALDECEGMRLLLSIREDYLAAVLPYEQALAGPSRTRSRLLPFGRDPALEAIRGPLRGTGRSYEPGAAEELVANLQTVKVTDARGQESTVTVDRVEPVQVQIVCSALWDSLPEGVLVITSAHVRTYADVDSFLATFCRNALSAVAKDYGIPAAKIRLWLQQTFITELGTRGTAYEGFKETAGMPNELVRALEDRHILKAEHRSSTRWYELQHDRLIAPIRQADPAEHLAAARDALKDVAKSGRGAASWEPVERHARQALRASGADELGVRAEAEYLMGEVIERRGVADEVKAALDHYHRAAELFEVFESPASVGKSLAASGRLLLARGCYSEAVADLQASIARNPADLDVQADLALALWHNGQRHSALAVLNIVLALDRNHAAALRVRGEILADMGNTEDALRDLDRVRHHQRPSTQAARALALALAGRLDAAEQEAADALANDADNGPLRLRVARVRKELNDPQGAAVLAAAALAAKQTPLPPHLRGIAQSLVDEALPPGAGPG